MEDLLSVIFFIPVAHLIILTVVSALIFEWPQMWVCEYVGQNVPLRISSYYSFFSAHQQKANRYLSINAKHKKIV